MIADGLPIRVVPDRGDMLRIGALGVGDVIGDVAHGRMVGLKTLACAAVGACELAELVLRTVKTGASGTSAIVATRRRARTESRAATQDHTPGVITCLWPGAPAPP